MRKKLIGLFSAGIAVISLSNPASGQNQYNQQDKGSIDSSNSLGSLKGSVNINVGGSLKLNLNSLKINLNSLPPVVINLLPPINVNVPPVSPPVAVPGTETNQPPANGQPGNQPPLKARPKNSQPKKSAKPPLKQSNKPKYKQQKTVHNGQINHNEPAKSKEAGTQPANQNNN